MKYDCLTLLSGGLDSILAVKLLQEQGLNVLGVHFVSPFFGDSSATEDWSEKFNIDIKALDISKDYTKLLSEGPNHGFGKNLNPCRDCKILMLKKLKELMPEYGAKFLATGEVIGQRPMSQMPDSLNLIEKEAGVSDILLRPLSAKKLPDTKPEREELVDTNKLMGLSGRSRKKQLELARECGIPEEDIPSPAGGCLLTQEELSKRYGKILKEFEEPGPEKFEKANVGRHFWKGDNWLIVGRSKEENEGLEKLRQEKDIFLEMIEPMGPSALLESIQGKETDEDIINKAVSINSYFSPKAKEKGEANVKVSKQKQEYEINTEPKDPQELGWQKPSVEELETAKEER